MRAMHGAPRGVACQDSLGNNGAVLVCCAGALRARHSVRIPSMTVGARTIVLCAQHLAGKAAFGCALCDAADRIIRDGAREISVGVAEGAPGTCAHAGICTVCTLPPCRCEHRSAGVYAALVKKSGPHARCDAAAHIHRAQAGDAGASTGVEPYTAHIVARRGTACHWVPGVQACCCTAEILQGNCAAAQTRHTRQAAGAHGWYRGASQGCRICGIACARTRRCSCRPPSWLWARMARRSTELCHQGRLHNRNAVCKWCTRCGSAAAALCRHSCSLCTERNNHATSFSAQQVRW